MASNVKISPADFAHIAKLSRLVINPDEQFIAKQLSQATEYIDILKELDTESVVPTYQVNNKKNVLRDDIITSSFTQKEALSQAKSTKDGYFKTSATIPAKGWSASGGKK